MECKVGNGNLTKEQRLFQVWARFNGYQHHVVRTLDEARAHLEELTQPAP
jgi:hypothetical protein